MIKNSINLIPDEIQRGWRRRRLSAWMTAAIAVYAVIIIAGILSQYSMLRTKRAVADSLEREKSSLIAGSARYAELTAKYGEILRTEGELKKRMSAVAEVSSRRVSWPAILKRLSHDIPPTVWLRALSTSDDQASGFKRLKFLGGAVSNRAVADFIFMLENAGYFSDVALTYSQKRDFDSKTVYDFELTALLRKTAELQYER